MKKVLIIVLLIALAGAMVVGPMMKSSSDEKEEAIAFLFKENLASKWGEIIPIDFELKTKMKELKLVYNDSLFQTWTNIEGKQTCELDASFYGLGTRSIVLEGTDEDGNKYIDRRLVRVVSDKVPQRWTYKIVNRYPHNVAHFTQGLEFSEGELYQGTGDPGNKGNTLIGKLDLKTGNYSQKIGLDASYFGEGISIMDEHIYQLTYTRGKCFVYDKMNLQIVKEFEYQGEGWGLCNDGEKLYMSNGSDRLTVRNKNTFEIEEVIEVADERGPIANINELEYVDGLIYAHVWMTDAIVVIQPENGKVLAVIDASELTRKGRGEGDVQNGIAYNKEKGTFFITGKYWNSLFEIKIEKPGIEKPV
jgi:glutamine cyclotransferase